MSTQVDDLKIKLEADAKSANSEIDKLISQVGKLQSALKNQGSGASNAFSSYTASAKKSISDLDSYVSRMSKDMEKKFTKEFMLTFKTDFDKKAFQNSIQKIVSSNAKAGKLSAQGDIAGSSAAMNEARGSVKELEGIIKDASKLNFAEAGKPLGDFVEMIRSYKNIAVGKEFFNTNNGGMSGHAIGRFTIDKGTPVDSIWSELVAKFPHLLSANSTNQRLDINEVLKKHEAGILSNEKANKAAIASGANSEIYKYIGKIYEDMEETFKTASKRMAEIRAKVNSSQFSGKDYAEKGGNFNSAEKVQSEIDKLQVKLYKLQSDLEFSEVGSTGFDRIATKAAIAENQIESLRVKLAELKGEDASFGTETVTVDSEVQEEVEGATHGFEGLSDAMSKVASNISLASVFNTIKSSISDTISVAQKATSAFLKFARVVGTPLDNAFKKLGKSIQDFSIKNIGLVKSLTRVLKMLKLMITRMALRGVISETKNAFTDLLDFSDRTANSFNKILTAIDYLAHTLAALAAPILNASGIFGGLGNIVDQITDKIVNLINKVNQLISALLGHGTWIKATKQAKTYKDTVKQTGKEVNKQLQSFDELNNLTTSDKSGGSDAGAGGGGYQELPIEKKWKDMAKWLKDMWNKGNGYELGRAIGNWLKNALDSIPWGLIQAKAAKLGKFLATTLNGFFETPGLAESIGNTIAGAINSGLSLVGEFIKQFHWDSFGTFIGTALVTAIKNIQWQRFIDACKDLGKGIAKAINALLDTDVIAWIGYALGKVLRGGIDFAFELITNIEWDKLGEQLMYGIRALFNQMNDVDETGLNGWQKLGKSISEAIKGALTAINKVLGDSEIRRQIGEAVTDLFSSFDYAGIREKLFELAGNILKLLGTVLLSAAKTGTFWQMLGDFGLIFATILGGKILKGFASFASSTLSIGLGKALGEAISSGAFASALGTGVSELGAMFSAIGEGASAAAAAIGTSVAAILGAIGLVIAAIVVWVKNWDEIKEAAALFCERTVEHMQNIANWIQTNLPNFTLLVTTCFNNIKIVVSAGLEAVKGFITNAFEFIKGIVQKAMSAISSFVSKGFELVKATVSLALNGLKSMIESASLATYNIITGNFTAVWNQVKTIFSNIYNFVSDIFNKLGQKLSDFGNNVKATFNDSLIGRALGYIRGNAGGGIFVGGKWQPIQGYASGGTPKSAEMFVARENGIPEMVGKIGSHTAVANNDQIVASVSDGVYRAVKAAMSGSGDRGTNVNIELVGDTANLFTAIRKEGNEYQRRTGNPVFA